MTFPDRKVLQIHDAIAAYRLTNEQWGLLAGKSPASAKAGPWYGAIKVLREWSLIDGTDRFGITAKGMAVAGDVGTPLDDTADLIRLARRGYLKSSQKHYDALTRAMTREELGEKLGIGEKSRKAGPWYGAIKEMIEAGLVHESGDKLARSLEELAPAERMAA